MLENEAYIRQVYEDDHCIHCGEGVPEGTYICKFCEAEAKEPVARLEVHYVRNGRYALFVDGSFHSEYPSFIEAVLAFEKKEEEEGL